jgi:hypothetical protein
MVCVFSFILFGSQDKYCKGLLKNIECIQSEFPDWEVWVYIGNGVPPTLVNHIESISKVRCIFTGLDGMVNKIYRFFPIDDPNVDICIIRDADSRIYTRDIECIKDFLNSTALLHIIRDHPNHFHRMMAGMWGIKKGAIEQSIENIFQLWKKGHSTTDFWDDTHFLTNVIYPMAVSKALVHDELHSFEPVSMKMNHRVPIEDGLHFIGQVYEYNEEGNEYPKFTDYHR